METVGIVSLLVLVIVGVALAVQAGLVLRRAGRLLDSLERDLPPLLEKANDVVDSMQDQMQRVDSVVESAKGVNDRLHSAATSANSLLTSPLARIAAIAAEAGSRLGKKKK